jgi:hypothetical protein
MANLFSPTFSGGQFFDNDGNVLVGGLIYSFIAGTSVPKAMFLDADGTPAANPFELDSAGRAPGFWLDSNFAYRIVVTDAGSTTVFASLDGVSIASGGGGGGGGTPDNIPNQVVQRDGQGQFGASTITFSPIDPLSPIDDGTLMGTIDFSVAMGIDGALVRAAEIKGVITEPTYGEVHPASLQFFTTSYYHSDLQKRMEIFPIGNVEIKRKDEEDGSGISTFRVRGDGQFERVLGGNAASMGPVLGYDGAIQLKSDSSEMNGITMLRVSPDAQGSVLVMSKQRGDGPVQSGDSLGLISFGGSDTDDEGAIAGASIDVEVVSDLSYDNVMTFSTSAANSLQPRVRISMDRDNQNCPTLNLVNYDVESTVDTQILSGNTNNSNFQRILMSVDNGFTFTTTDDPEVQVPVSINNNSFLLGVAKQEVAYTEPHFMINTNYASAAIVGSSPDGQGGMLALASNRGGPTGYSPTIAGDLLGAVQFNGSDGLSINPGAGGLFAIATEDWTPTTWKKAMILQLTSSGFDDAEPGVLIWMSQLGYTGFQTSEPAYTVDVAGDVHASLKVMAGEGLALGRGSNLSTDVVTLVAGTVNVPNTSVTVDSIVMLTVQVAGGTQGFLSIGTVTPGVGFDINSSSGTDVSVVAYQIIEPV